MSFEPKWASAPGNTIKDILESRNISADVFSDRIGWSRHFIDRLLIGGEAITNEYAYQLSEVLGASSHFWLSRESQFRASLIKLENESWLNDLPIGDMLKLGWIRKTPDLLTACFEYFDVPNLHVWHERYNSIEKQIAFRISSNYSIKASSVASWIRKGEIEAERVECQTWNSAHFLNSLEQIKSLTRQKSPSDFVPRLREICAECGVAVVIVRTPNGCAASGMTKFISPSKALLMLSFRYLSDDQFWFTFFHEAGHLILHGDKELFLEGITDVHMPDVTRQEHEANSFASEMLIPHHLHSQLRQLRGKWNISRFASNLGISPGIVVGQMQYYRFAEMKQLNGYKRRYNWEEISSI